MKRLLASRRFVVWAFVLFVLGLGLIPEIVYLLSGYGMWDWYYALEGKAKLRADIVILICLSVLVLRVGALHMKYNKELSESHARKPDSHSRPKEYQQYIECEYEVK